MIRTALFFMVLGVPAVAETPAVVTDIPAIGSLVQQVMGDLGEPRVILPSGGNAHDYQMRPSDAGALQDADLLVWIGPGLTPWLDRAARNLTDAKSLILLNLPETHRLSADVHDAGDHDHDGGEGDTDPHAWLDPQNGKVWVAAIADALAVIDPANAATYAANAAATADSIDQADAEAARLLDPVKAQRFAVMHDAYGYFTGHYDLPPAVPLALGDATTPSAERMGQVRAQIVETGVRCAFPEIGHDPALLESLAEGTDIRIGAPIDTSGGEAAGNAPVYQAILTNMAATLADCLAQE